MFDAMVSKGFSFRERYKVNVTGTFSNAFNHPVYYGANNTLQSTVSTSNATGTVTPNASASFGQFNASQTAGMSRIIRVGAEFVF
jgi:hypothetical protein